MDYNIEHDKDVWINGYNLAYYNSSQKVISLTHFYGTSGKASIEGRIRKVEPENIEKAIKKLLKHIRSEKKYITAVHGITEYLDTIDYI